MARVSLSPPPSLGSTAKYSDYKPWLLENFYYYLCSYCLLHNSDVQVEHYEPTSYAPAREHDPTNLLLACPTCNGNGGKGDYHPNHEERRRKPNDQTGYLVADVRSDDFGKLFTIDRATGEIGAAPGPHLKRAAWNIALLKLDLQHRQEIRKSLCEGIEICDQLIAELDSEPAGKTRDAMVAARTHLLSGLQKRVLFLTVHDVSIPPVVAAAMHPGG